MPRPTKVFIEERKALFLQGQRRCRACQRILPLSSFRQKGNALDGIDNTCIACQDADYQRRWREDTAYRTKHLAQARAWHREYMGKDRRQRRYWLKSRYALSIEQYDAMVEAQHGKCAICGKVPSERPLANRESQFGLHVDHDPRTGKGEVAMRLRELLCHQCNTGLGKFKDDPELLEQAAAYLRKHI